jgi:hypothetical protein
VQHGDIFNSEFNLRFKKPQPYSCPYCDKLFIQLVAADTEYKRPDIETQSKLHHMKAEGAYKTMAEDTK